MEEWEVNLDTYPSSPDFRSFAKIIEVAGFVIKQDLAPFEFDWFLYTLLYKPVNLLFTVELNKNDTVWEKPIGDSFKLLADIASDMTEHVDKYFEEIVTLCNQSFDPQIRKQSLLCLCRIAAVSPYGAINAKLHVNRLEESNTCKAPLAQLVGTICEHHPDTVASDVNKIWRIYLNCLESNKNTDTLTQSYLQGILGLFKHFGFDLPLLELKQFYENLSKDYLKRNRCQDVCLEILTHHSNLFRECIVKDSALRTYLCWLLSETPKNEVNSAVDSVYRTLCGPLLKEQMLQIARNEIMPLTHSARPQVKYKALKLISTMSDLAKVDINRDSSVDVQALEFELRNETVIYEVAEAVSYCIQAEVPNYDKLLQTAVLFYSSLPAARRKEIVVHGLLSAETILRTTTTNFLISESTIDNNNLERHLSLWNDIFDTNNGLDAIVMEKSKYVFEDVLTYTVTVLENFLDVNEQVLQPKIINLLKLTANIISLQSIEPYTVDHCGVLLPILIDMQYRYDEVSIISCARSCFVHLQESDFPRQFVENICIDRCKDEVTLCESCLTLIQAPDDAVDVGSVLQALQIIFSRNDVEYSTLTKSLKKFEFVFGNYRENLDKSVVYNILNQLENLRRRNDIKIKEARILHRDIVMFLGKYGNTVDCNNRNIDLSIAKLMSNLTLNVSNPDAGLSYKLNLQRILHLALDLEDHRALQTLLSIICANLSPSLRPVLPRVCVAVARSYSRGNMTSSRPLIELAAYCADATFCTSIAGYISEEKSPGVRKMLADVLEAVVAMQDDEVVMTVADHSSVMMMSDDATTKRAGLSISQILITALKENNSLTKILVPKMLVLISKTQEIDSTEAFDECSKHFLEKIELFDNDSVFDVIDELLDVLLMADFDKLMKNRNKDKKQPLIKDFESKATPNLWKARKLAVKMILVFIKSIFSYKNWLSQKFLDRFFEKQVTVSQNLFCVLAEMRIIFDFDTSMCRKVLSYEDCKAVDALFCMEFVWDSNFCIESVLMFLEEYSELLLEMKYNNTLELLKRIMENMTPDCVKGLKKNITNTLSKYNLDTLKMALENWCQKQNFKEITTCLEKELFTEKHAVKVAALKTMLQAFKMADLSHLTAVRTTVKVWAKILLNLHSRDYIANYLKSKMRYLTDLLTVSLMFSSREEIKVLLLEGSNLPGLPAEKIGVAFCRFFISCFYDFLVAKPFVLLDVDASPVSLLVKDVVKYSLVKKRCDEDYKLVLELVDKIWLIYFSQTNFNEKLVLLQDLSMLPVKLTWESNPMQWAVGVIDSNDTATADKTRLICVLPGGEQFCASYRNFASCLPVRLSEMRGEALSAFRCILDALAATGDLVLMDIVMTLADCDESKGWWDEAIDSCMASLAAREDLALYKAAYSRTGDLTLGSCRRVLVPLLRYAKSSFCEKFFSSIVMNLLSAKKLRTTMSEYDYHRALVDYTRRFIILGVAFEKLSAIALESPTSQLYSDLKPQQSWYLVRQACRMCNDLRIKIPLMEGASEKIVKVFRMFHCENYNCLSAAICRKKPALTFYEQTIFKVDIWDQLIDHDEVIDVKIRQQWNYRKQRKSTAISIENASVSLSGLQTSTVRTKMFLRTLSENVMMYDLIQNEEEEIQTQEIQLTSNPLNDHPNASNLTALMCHMLTIVGEGWIDCVASGLRQGKKYTRWLLAQVICNCKEDLKCKASALRPALLDVITSTPVEYNGKSVLNGLHIDIVETLILWNDTNPESSDNLNKCLELMLNTILEHRKHESIYKTLIDVLGKFLNIYNSCVDVSLDVEPYLADDEQATKTLDVLRIVSKNKIKVPNLLATLIGKMETKLYYKLLKMAELFGLALNCCDDKQTYLLSFKKILDQLRKSSAGEYVKILYYAQSACPECCDEYNFRQITDLAPKLVGPEKAKCLNILSTFLSNANPSNNVKDIFNSMDLPEIVLSVNEAGLKLVKSGLHLLKDGAKRKIVAVSYEFCKSSLVKVRRVAFEVIVAAFEDLMSSAMLPPASKRAKLATTQIIKYVEDEGVYIRTVFKCISIGLIDLDQNISGSVRTGVAKHLNKYDLGLRFTECFLLSTYLPILNSDKRENLSVCPYALLDMLLEDLLSQERFKVLRLRDEPLDIRQPHTGFTKLLTMSASYQGTFKSANLSGRSKNLKLTGQGDNAPAIDVQISIENILNTFLQLSKDHPAMSQALCLEFVKALPGIEPKSTVAEALVSLLRKTNELTPFVVELCEMFVEDIYLVHGVQDSIEALKSVTRNTEGERMVRNMYNDILMRKTGDEHFVLGDDFGDEIDEMMVADDEEYCIDDVSTAFKKLSNWDTLTVKERKNVLSCGLPTLWTDKGTFKLKLDEYTPAMDWFGKLCSAYKGEGREECMKWLRSLDQWPRSQFEVSAIVEAIEWLCNDTERTDLVFDVQREDCLVEWSARLLIRAAHLEAKGYESKQTDVMLSRSHELLWCKRANEMELPSLVLSCAKRNTPDLYESETLGWLHERLLALRTLAGLRDDTSKLKKLLEDAEKYTPEFTDHAKVDDVINMNTLMMRLNMDLKLQNVNIANVHVALDELMKEKSDEAVNKDGIDTFYVIATQYLASCCNDSNQEETLSNMIDILHRMGNSNITNCGIVSMVLNKLYDSEGICMEEEVAYKLLNQIQKNYADDFVIRHLAQLKNLFPSRSLAKYSSLWERDGDMVVKFKKCLQLVCDPDYSLLQYCDELIKVIEGNTSDAKNAWSELFSRVKGKLFENSYAGDDYLLLNRYKDKLYEICPYDDSLNFKTKARNVLQEVMRQLKYRNPQNVLRLSQLCPELSRVDKCPAKLFGLPDTVGVVKIYEQIPVFTDSIRRPALLKILLTNGQTKRYIHKSGENLANDAAAQSIAIYAGRLWKEKCKIVCYNVTQLSDDCGLIEYLEDHERLRDLVRESCDLNDVLTSIRRPAELIISPIQSNLNCFKQFCDKVPANCLKNAISRRSVSQNDFLIKINKFQETVASSTIITWLLGLGDRHLENILYSTRDGGLCHIDWGGVFQYGRNEIPAARLTRNILAVCDNTALEAKLQELLTILRESRILFSAVLDMTLKCVPKHMDDASSRATYAKAILEGKYVSFDKLKSFNSLDELKKSKFKELLKNVFDNFQYKGDVESQIKHLLRLSTDPRILSVTRSEWEPWV